VRVMTPARLRLKVVKGKRSWSRMRVKVKFRLTPDGHNSTFLPRDAKRGLAITSCYRMSSVRPSILLSVTLVDHDHIG